MEFSKLSLLQKCLLMQDWVSRLGLQLQFHKRFGHIMRPASIHLTASLKIRDLLEFTPDRLSLNFIFQTQNYSHQYCCSFTIWNEKWPLDKKVTRALDGQPANVTEHFWFNFFEKVNKNIWQVVARKDLTIFDFTNLFTNQKSKVDLMWRLNFRFKISQASPPITYLGNQNCILMCYMFRQYYF